MSQRSNTEEIKVYKMNDYEWWASKLPIEETEKFYEKEIGEVNDIENIEECDIDNDGMWWNTEDQTDLETLGDNDELTSYETINGQMIKKVRFGDLMRQGEEVYKYISLREAIERSGENTEPFCIASTEW